MGQIADACENRKIVILNDDVSAPCRIEKEAGWAPFARRPTKQVPAPGRAARLCITVTFLTTTFLASALLAPIWASEATAGALGVESDQMSPAGERSVQPAQAITGDPEELQKALDQEHRRAELLARELTTVRHLEMLLTERAEALAKDLSTAHATIYAYEAQARNAVDQAADSQQAAENGATAALKISAAGAGARRAA